MQETHKKNCDTKLSIMKGYEYENKNDDENTNLKYFPQEQ